MNIYINGENEEIKEEEVSITKLLSIKNVDMPEMVTVELNGDIVDRENFDTTFIKSDDKLELLYFMGGGSFTDG